MNNPGDEQMSEVVVLVTFVTRPGKEEEAERFLGELLAPTHSEPGCLLYAVHRGLDDPLRMAFVERWESRELLEQHIAGDHIQEALKVVDEYFSAGPEIVFYEAIDGGEPDKGSIAGHAAGAAVGGG
jgi:quinol monooxygenase YgiN